MCVCVCIGGLPPIGAMCGAFVNGGAMAGLKVKPEIDESIVR